MYSFAWRADGRDVRIAFGLFGGRSEAERYEPSQLGVGIADMLTEKLLETGQFREIIASMSAEGLSRKGGGLRVAGIGSHGFGGVDVNSSNFRATAIGEATERAVSNLAESIVQVKTSF